MLLNGPPGCGKSTIARMYVRDHPLSLDLDVDHVRRLLGGWQDAPEESGRLARRMALEMARVHLLAGRDVVVPQYLGRVEFIEDLERLAGSVPADFHEVVLLAGKADIVRRFDERGPDPVDPVHREAREMVERDGGLPAVERMYDLLLEIVAARPRSVVVRAEEGDVDGTYASLLSVLAEP